MPNGEADNRRTQQSHPNESRRTGTRRNFSIHKNISATVALIASASLLRRWSRSFTEV